MGIPSFIYPRKIRILCDDIIKFSQKSIKSITKDVASSLCFKFLEECHSYDPQIANDCKKIAILYRRKVFQKLALWFRKNLSKPVQSYMCYFSNLIFGFIPYAKYLCNVFEGEQAYNVIFNLIELIRTNIQKIDPICESVCTPPQLLQFDDY